MRTFALAVALLVVAGMGGWAADVEDDPEPPGGTNLRKLEGKWVSVRKILKGKETEYVNMSTYTFERDKVHYTWQKQAYSMKVEVDKKRPFALTLTRDNVAPRKHYFKIEKGELYLTLDRDNDPNAKPDFTSGNKSAVFIYKREK